MSIIAIANLNNSNPSLALVESLERIDLPRIHGAEWDPENALDFCQPLSPELAKNEVLRFIVERHDGHLQVFCAAWEHLVGEEKPESWDGQQWHEFSSRLCQTIEQGLSARLESVGHADSSTEEVIPRRDFTLHLQRRTSRFLIDLRLALRRVAHYMTIDKQLRLEWQEMMLRTRAMDEHLKRIFMEGLPTPDGGSFGGKGFRSTWQEAVVAVASALNRDLQSPKDASPANGYSGDIVGPMIRDAGLCLAMGDTIQGIMAAQLGKSGSNQDGGWSELAAGGRDLHVGAWNHGVLPPTAPLPIASATITGLALAAKLTEQERFHVACIGEGASSSGEWWESLNLAGVRGLPVMYILQNNQIALDTVVSNQSAVELWADKAVAMGMPSWTIDGSDPAAWYAASATAREFSLSGGGATLMHVETMRGCGHAHHHDDLYLGAESGNPPGYVDRDLLSYWKEKDPLVLNHKLLLELGVDESEITGIEQLAQEEADAAIAAVEAMPWPDPSTVTKGVTSISDAQTHRQHLDRYLQDSSVPIQAPLGSGENLNEFGTTKGSWTYSRAIQQAMVKIADRYGENTVFMGEDMEVAGAFGMNIPLKNAGYENLLLDMPLSESIIINSATGAALSGMRPMAEIQFGGFAALAFNALVNNASMLRWRWGAKVPLTVRIPLGGKTRSGPFHANMIETWFANDCGLIVCTPSTPQDAYDILVEAAALDDPVLFLEHIGLYGLRGGKTAWGDDINQIVEVDAVNSAVESGERYAIGKAQTIRGGKDLTIVTWGAMTHVALKAADIVADEGVQVEIIDLRTILPFDAETCVASVQRTGRLIVLQEGQWCGGLGHTIQSRILEEAFFGLESAPMVIGALDTPVPFSPPLEDYTIPDVDLVVESILLLCNDA
jgi:pyruvate/2-oxoglutarate/acetoin dehydrogenase E1 component/TPP-dependent pyruvate/acetoin dehydrogenase alpha subunit